MLKNKCKQANKIVALSLAFTLAISMFSFSYANAEVDDVLTTYSDITNTEDLQQALEQATTEKEAESILANTDETFVVERFAELVEDANTALMEIQNVDSEQDAIQVAEESDVIQNISYSEASADGTFVSKTAIQLDDVNSITVTMVDAPDNISSASAGTMYGYEVWQCKDWGDRYFHATCELQYLGYPDAALQSRIGYSLNTSKTINGRYLVGYNDLNENLVSGQNIYYDDLYYWYKKAANSTYVSGRTYFTGQFLVMNGVVLTYNYSVYMRAEVLAWKSYGAYMYQKAAPDVS